MTSKTLSRLDPNTLGDTPAALYLVDILNHSPHPIERNLLRYITVFRHHFNQLVKACDDGHLEPCVVQAFIQYKKKELKEQTSDLLSKGYTQTALNLYANIVNGDMRKFLRRQKKVFDITHSAQDRARAVLKNNDITGEDYPLQVVRTFGRSEDQRLDVEVRFNAHGLPQVIMDHSLVRDGVTSQSLMEKSQARLRRQQLRRQTQDAHGE